MITWLSDLLSFTFLWRALAVGALVSLCAALLGVCLVLKRFSMIGDGLSHVGFGALAAAAALHLAPLAVAIPVVSGAAFLLLRLGRGARLRGDAAIGLVSTGALAAGVLIISLSGGGAADLSGYLFGSILAMSESDLWLSVGLATVVLLVFALFCNRIFAVTFDETFARATGIRVNLCNALLALLTAVTVVLGMRMMGTLLISSLIIIPALTAMRLCRRFWGVMAAASAVSVFCFLCGLLGSYAFSTPVGASVVAVNLVVFGVACLFGALRARH